MMEGSAQPVAAKREVMIQKSQVVVGPEHVDNALCATPEESTTVPFGDGGAADVPARKGKAARDAREKPRQKAIGIAAECRDPRILCQIFSQEGIARSPGMAAGECRDNHNGASLGGACSRHVQLRLSIRIVPTNPLPATLVAAIQTPIELR